MDRHHNRKKSASWCSRANQIEMRWPVCSKIYEATAGLSVGVVPHFWPACPVLPTAWQAVSSHCARRPLCRTTYRSCQRDFPDPAMLWERPGQTKKDAQQIWRTSRHLPSRCLIATQMLPPCAPCLDYLTTLDAPPSNELSLSRALLSWNDRPRKKWKLGRPFQCIPPARAKVEVDVITGALQSQIRPLRHMHALRYSRRKETKESHFTTNTRASANTGTGGPTAKAQPAQVSAAPMADVLLAPLPRARRTNCHQVRLRTSYTGPAQNGSPSWILKTDDSLVTQ